jgi:hypothetical protein
MGAWGRPADYVCIASKDRGAGISLAEESDADSVRDGLLPGGGMMGRLADAYRLTARYSCM